MPKRTDALKRVTTSARLVAVLIAGCVVAAPVLAQAPLTKEEEQKLKQRQLEKKKGADTPGRPPPPSSPPPASKPQPDPRAERPVQPPPPKTALPKADSGRTNPPADRSGQGGDRGGASRPGSPDTGQGQALRRPPPPPPPPAKLPTQVVVPPKGPPGSPSAVQKDSKPSQASPIINQGPPGSKSLDPARRPQSGGGDPTRTTQPPNTGNPTAVNPSIGKSPPKGGSPSATDRPDRGRPGDPTAVNPANGKAPSTGVPPPATGKADDTRRGGPVGSPAATDRPDRGRPGDPTVINPANGKAPPTGVSPPVTGKADDTRRGAPDGPPPTPSVVKGKGPSPDAPGLTNVVRPPVGPQRIEEIRQGRVESVGKSGARIIQEPGNRTIVKQDNRSIITRNETTTINNFIPAAKSSRQANGITETVYNRPGGVRVISEVDGNGRLLRRYRRDEGGREVVFVDNRRFYRNLAVGAGIGIVAAAAIIALSPPVHALPREKYVVDYVRATDDDIYETFTAPPVERLERSYSLEEIRYSENVRARMRRIDLDNITFETGSFDVTPDQYAKLERIARAIIRAIEANPAEVFLIEGHTDAVGPTDDNLSLSDRRAESVARILAERYEIPIENLVTQGYGEQHLKIDTSGPERGNRRVAMRRITPLLSEKEDRN